MKSKFSFSNLVFVCLFITYFNTRGYSQELPNHPLSCANHTSCQYDGEVQAFQNSESEFTHDIAFVLRGFDGSCEACDTFSYQMHAKKITEFVGNLSFGKIKTFKIFLAGIDERSPDFMQGLRDIEVLQASLDGWPGSRWSWLGNRTDYWKIVPAEYRPIITNAIDWIKVNKSNFLNWGLVTNEGKVHYQIIQNNVQRMGSSAAQDYLKDMIMPQGFDRRNFKLTLVMLNTAGTATIAGGGAQSTFDYFGIKDPNGVPYRVNADGVANSVAYIGAPLNSVIAYTIPIHEAIHGFGMGTHDQDPNQLANNYSVMNYTNVSTFNTLPAWNRYFWCKWLPKTTITNNANEVVDIKDKVNLEDANHKYILEVVKGDNLGRGGTYREKFDGKWYTYKVDQFGTLTFLDKIDKPHIKILNYIDAIPEVIVENKKAIFKIFHDGEREWTYQWMKNGIPIANSNRDSLILSNVKLSDAGSYSVRISNSLNSLTTKPVNVKVLCAVSPITLANEQIEFCQNVGASTLNVKADTGNNLLWYTSDSATVGSSIQPIITSQNAGIFQYYVSQVNSVGCESLKSSVKIKVKASPAIPTLTQLNNSQIRSSAAKNFWYLNGVLLADTLSTIKPILSGNYTAVAIENDCRSQPSQVLNFVVTSIGEEEFKSVILQPNPFSDFITIDYQDANKRISKVDIISPTGEIVISLNNIESRSQIDMTKLSAGIYFLRIQMEAGKIMPYYKLLKY